VFIHLERRPPELNLAWGNFIGIHLDDGTTPRGGRGAGGQGSGGAGETAS
jgi:hypothetical protein